ncbi:hypothetical protein BAE44_0006268 [Dichanthelium oligosanthes]|uniref:Late embryogenesis abundant protein LEA-2 subgroup domain-containing protein n=1 Tax=Dichanthelium oligosanthes TaxID=888268 RepID=A0A1E5W636_9POAL|nr:hypothetical protein BAE44_0006268 [Dichanthelium oligosanthes]
MAAAGGDDDDGKNSTFRWIHAARYAVALVVTVLIVSVIVNAIKVVLRSDPLHLSVVGGHVSTGRLPSPSPSPSPSPPHLLDKQVALDFNLRAQNPSGRARMYYVGITAYFFDNKTSSSTSDLLYECMVATGVKDIAVLQQEATDTIVRVHVSRDNMPEYFKSLYDGGRMSGVTLRLNGSLITEVTSKFKVNKTRVTTYYCKELLFGGDPRDEAFKNRQDVLCSYE